MINDFVANIVGMLFNQWRWTTHEDYENESMSAFSCIICIYLKGVLSLRNFTRRVILQGVYELFDKQETTEWCNKEERVNRFVFIGKILYHCV